MRLVHVLRRLTTLRSAGGILVVFSLGVLLPALLLTAFGVSAWLRERQVGEAQIRDELERAADLAAGQLEAGLRPWQEMVEDVAEGRPPKAPPQLEPAGAERGVFVIARAGADAASLWPAGQVLYGPDRIASDGPVETDRLRAIAAVELVERDYHGAIALYRKHLASASQAEGAVMLLRLARVYRKAGATAEALAVYRQIETSSERIGTLPIDLLARFETCTVLAAGRPLDAAPRALALYRDLVGGRWLLEKSRFLFYADEARAWASGRVDGAAEIARLDDIAARKRALTEAADAAIAGTSSAEQRATFVTLTPGDREPGGPKAIAVIRTDWLSGRVWPRAFARTIDGGFDVAVATSGGGPHYDSRSPSAAATESPWAASRAARIGGVGWTLEVRPRDAAGQLADLKRRRQVYMLMLVSIVALLGLGTFLTGRVVKREIEVARLKADFVSTVSHEFRSPLTGIRQLGEMLARGRVPSEARRLEDHERITSESDRLSRLVENLLDFSRMEEGRRSYRFEPLEPTPWLRRFAESCRTEFAVRSVSVVASIPESLPAVVADEEALTCAVHNLMDNAVKYSPGRDAVWLDAESDGRHVTIRVRDAGVGIAPEDRPRVFEKFYRGSGEITRQVAGVGLGLSLVQHIVAAHGGDIQCDSRPGQGCTFSIRLQAAASTGA